MTTKAITIVLSILLFTFTALASVGAGARHDGQGHRGKGGHGWGCGPLKMLNKLDLTQEQKKAVAEVLSTHREDIGNVVTGIGEAKSAMRKVMLADDSTEEAVRDAAQKVGAQKEEAAVLFAKIAGEIKTILTPEQKEKLSAMKEKRGERMKGYMDSRLKKLDAWIAENSDE